MIIYFLTKITSLCFRFREELKEKCDIVDRLENQLQDLSYKDQDKFDHQKIREDNLTKKIEQLEERLRDLQSGEERLHTAPRSGDWGWEDGEGEMMNMSNDSPAIFGVPNSKPHPANSAVDRGHSNHYNSSQVNEVGQLPLIF